jgi:AcrR family transcriptional regulator
MSSGDPETRRRILDAARSLLEARAGAVVSMGEVAAEAGVSRQALYLHFGDRATLYIEVSRDVDARERAPRQAKVDDASDARAALRAAVELQAWLKPRIHGIATALDTLRRSDAAAEAAWREREDERLTRCTAVMRRAGREGLLAQGWTPDRAGELLWAITSLHTWEDLVIVRGWSDRRYTRHILSVLERGIITSD